jgi:iron complex transport system ATP-binding protein
MPEAPETPIPGIAVVINEKAVRVTSVRPLTVLSSAVVGGGLCSARDIVNMHVDKDYDRGSPGDDLAAFALSSGVNGTFVGLMTAACTEHACVVAESRDGVTVAAAVSVGLTTQLWESSTSSIQPAPAMASGKPQVVIARTAT